MPEFILDNDVSRQLTDAGVDAFTRGYITAAYFTGTGGDERPDSDTPLCESSIIVARFSCEAFQSKAAALLARAYDLGYDAESAGADFWYTRNGHGVGYWDRDQLDIATDVHLQQPGATQTLGDQLTALCKEFPEVSLCEGDDGRLYFA